VRSDEAQYPATITQIAALIRLGRPFILPGGTLAYVLGAAMGYAHQGAFDWGRAIAGLLVTTAANLVAHYADEYADVDTDTVTRRSWFSGGSGVLPSGIVPPVWALRMAWAMLTLAALLTFWFVGNGTLTPHVIWIVALGVLGGWFYSMPPVALERRGLGELVNAAIGAFLMPLMGYTVQTGTPSWHAAVALIPIFFIVMAALLAVHWADRQADAAVGKRSLVVVAGRYTPLLYYGSILLAFLSTLLLTGTLLPAPVSAAILFTLPITLWAALRFMRQDSPVPSSLAMAVTIAAAAAGWVLAA
jgi:1,4-dihydroxy-2-naphthoate octaprenyltransferase